jgi:uncharacterized sulfatase
MVHWRRASALMLAAASLALPEARGAAQPSPNILWITCEDISPNLGCYGDTYAVTPNLDALARQSVRFDRAYAVIGVCAPSRSAIITAMYPPSIGTHHMRCQGVLPRGVRCFPAYLRDAGYYCTNNTKTDYNFTHPPDTWDDSSRTAHWRNRRKGQPFFAVFNFTTSHESQIRLPEDQYRERTREFTAAERHDPSRAPLPPYHPDTPEVRRDWACYYDMITYMDKQVGNILRQLEQDALAGSTIVVFFSDHGAGMPRSKRWLYESSTRVPLLVRFPEAFGSLAPGSPGSATDRLVSLIDAGPTVLSLAGIEPPAHMQGIAFLGAHAAPERTHVYSFRDRMDERTDMIRSVRDSRYRYIRNYLPHRPWFHEQHIRYMYEMLTMQVWQRMADAGQLQGPAASFMAREKPAEELYEVLTDPWEVNNLAGDPAHRETLERLRSELQRWQRSIVDLGLLPEPDLRTRFGDSSPYDSVREDPARYPIERIHSAASLASSRLPRSAAALADLLRDDDPAVRWWGATGLGALGRDGQAFTSPLSTALADKADWVRIAAADALARMARETEAIGPLSEALASTNPWTRLHAVEALDRIGPTARPARDALERARSDENEYVRIVAEHGLLQIR